MTNWLTKLVAGLRWVGWALLAVVTMGAVWYRRRALSAEAARAAALEDLRRQREVTQLATEAARASKQAADSHRRAAAQLVAQQAKVSAALVSREAEVLSQPSGASRLVEAFRTDSQATSVWVSPRAKRMTPRDDE